MCLLQHWIRLEMQQDVLINRLYVRVEPSDSSYMPSLVVVSGGDSIHSMKELKTVNIGATETLVTLLQDVTEVQKPFKIILDVVDSVKQRISSRSVYSTPEPHEILLHGIRHQFM